MCGRYLRRADKQRIAEAFRLGELPEGFVLPEWDYNVAPTTFQPVIRNARETGRRELVLMRWGLVPTFATSLAEWKGVSTINAQAESLMTRALWSDRLRGIAAWCRRVASTSGRRSMRRRSSPTCLR